MEENIALEEEKETSNTSLHEECFMVLRESLSAYFFNKTTWIVQALAIFLMFGTLVFTGIEGNNAKVRNYELFIEQAEFNKSNTANKSMEEYGHFYNRIFRKAELECKLAKLDLYGWNSMEFMDTMLYSFSIISTTGWGLRKPTSILYKSFTIAYAMIGLPLVSALIGLVVRITKSDKRIRRTLVFVKKWFGNYKIVAALAIKLGVVYIVLQGYISSKMVYQYSTDDATKKKYTKVGYSRVWSLTEGIYCYVINGMTTIGFGEQHIFGPGYENPGPRFLSMLFQMLLLIVAVALMELGFEVVRKYFDRSLEKKIQEKTYQTVKCDTHITYTSSYSIRRKGPRNGYGSPVQEPAAIIAE